MIRSITYIESFCPKKVSVKVTVGKNGIVSIGSHKFGSSLRYVILHNDGTNISVKDEFVMITELKPKMCK